MAEIDALWRVNTHRENRVIRPAVYRAGMPRDKLQSPLRIPSVRRP